MSNYCILTFEKEKNVKWAVLGLVPCLNRAWASPAHVEPWAGPVHWTSFFDPGPAQVFVPCRARPINICAHVMPCLI